MKLLRLWIFPILLILLTSCNSATDKAQNDEVVDKTLPSISIIADSEESLALFQQEKNKIEKMYGVRLEFHYPNRLNDNLEEFLFASKNVTIFMSCFQRKYHNMLKETCSCQCHYMFKHKRYLMT